MSLLSIVKAVYKAIVPLRQRIYLRVHFETYKYKFYPSQKRFGTYRYVLPDKEATAVSEQLLLRSFKPSFSLVLPLDNDVFGLEHTLHSLKKQWYPYSELIIGTSSSNIEVVKKVLEQVGISQYLFSTTGDLTSLLQKATGDYVGIVYAQDELTPDCLYKIATALNTTLYDFIYTDHDIFEKPTQYTAPCFKPDYAPIKLLSQNYIENFVCFNNIFLQALLKKTTLCDAPHYDLLLQTTEETKNIFHITEVLYHQYKPTASNRAERQLSEEQTIKRALERRGINAILSSSSYPGIFCIRRTLTAQPLISIITPFKDKSEILKKCLDSILQHSTYSNFEFIGISNNSQHPNTFAFMEAYSKKDPRIHFYEKNIPFNYSLLNNFAVSKAQGEHLILLNNDIEIITPEWIEALLEYSQLAEVGAVGAKLYYPNNKIQHAGIVIDSEKIALHSHRMFKRSYDGYEGYLRQVQNVSAVTAACLMVKKSLYNEMGGLEEEHLQVAFNDVDFCLRLQENGYANIFTPYCEAYHYESISRGLEDTPEKMERFKKESHYLRQRHSYVLAKEDPYFNPNLRKYTRIAE